MVRDYIVLPENTEVLSTGDGYVDYRASELLRYMTITGIRFFPYDVDTRVLLCARVYVADGKGESYYFEVLPACRREYDESELRSIQNADDLVIRVYKIGKSEEPRWISVRKGDDMIMSLGGYEVVYGPMRSFWNLYKSED